jgi:hypothetical protein
MGLFSWLFGRDDDPEKIAEIADEIDRFADRFENADDQESAAFARGYAQRIRKLTSVKEAKALRAEFLAIIEKDGRLARDEQYREHYRDDDSEAWSDDS